jgi:hypothetical protein
LQGISLRLVVCCVVLCSGRHHPISYPYKGAEVLLILLRQFGPMIDGWQAQSRKPVNIKPMIA